MKFETTGVCSREIDFEVEDGVVTSINFVKGCDGNLKGLGNLVVGMKVEDVIEKLKGITCGPRKTSCPDQLSKALEAYLEQENLG